MAVDNYGCCVIDPANDVNHWFDGTTLRRIPAGSLLGNTMVAIGYPREQVDATVWAKLTSFFPVTD